MRFSLRPTNSATMSIIKTQSFELSVLSRGEENSKNFALILPGRLDTKDYGNFTSHAEHLANNGFRAVVFDPPGTWESPGDISLYTTTNYLRAINEVIEYYGNKPTLLLGHSRGAAAAILASMNHPAIIGIVPIMPNLGAPTPPGEQALQLGFKLEHRDVPPGTSPTEEQREFKLPINYWADGAKYNPAQALKDCTKPKLLIYGNRDKFTPVEEITALFETLPEPKALVEVSSDHDYRYHPEVVDQINDEIGKFIETYNLK